ncbi:MAG: hypothetical protein WDZ94_02540 [Patescibacteria group bacterium]
MHDLVSIIKTISLFILQWATILLLYVAGLYSMVFFQEIFNDMSGWSLPSLVRSLIMITWAAIPVSILGFLLNRSFLHLSKKIFWYLQIAFIISVWLSLTLVIYIS